MLAAAVVPMGQDAEIMGFYLFASQVLSWLPTLVSTAIKNEAGISQRVGLPTLNIYFFIALGASCMMGGYREAVILCGRMLVDGPDNKDVEEVGNGSLDEKGQLVNAAHTSTKMEIIQENAISTQGD